MPQNVLQYVHNLQFGVIGVLCKTCTHPCLVSLSRDGTLYLYYVKIKSYSQTINFAHGRLQLDLTLLLSNTIRIVFRFQPTAYCFFLKLLLSFSAIFAEYLNHKPRTGIWKEQITHLYSWQTSVEHNLRKHWSFALENNVLQVKLLGVPSQGHKAYMGI